ncbi:uncharacterized protein TM35_001401010 [Trypanosoma theileri]|uniref:Mucin TcMUCII n=1 Tax=Trypanosoma theileri TaxID=67003 RepID=A0A1X0NDD7_9TRYP|nr:uncharacterized protein TM35_001401010 [Trypanosoma theileri]ORC80838.1 hypothetical protein TM35_001401010 [Trypanosoma theileri]
MCRVMCVLAVVLCCACGYTMADPATTVNAGQPKAVMASEFEDFLVYTSKKYGKCMKDSSDTYGGKTCKELGFINKTASSSPQEKRPEGRDTPVAAAVEVASRPQGDRTMEGEVSVNEPQGGASEVAGSSTEAAQQKPDTSATTPQRQSPGSNGAGDGDQGASDKTGDNSTPATSNRTQHSSAQASASAAPDSQETNAITPPSTENTVNEESTTTIPSPVTDPQSSTIAPTVQNKANVVDSSSMSSFWMRTAAPLLIVAVLVSVTVY